MSRLLVMSYGELPPSDNHIREIGYIFQGGKRHAIIHYTAEAEDYKKLFVQHVSTVFFTQIQEFARGHMPWSVYRFEILLHVPAEDLLTAGWLKGKAVHPFKQWDTANRDKLIADAVAAATGIDDSLYFCNAFEKRVSFEGAPSVLVTLEEDDPRSYGVPGSYLRDYHERATTGSELGGRGAEQAERQRARERRSASRAR